MKKYIVLASFVVFSVKSDGKTQEHSLKKNDTIELPGDNITVRALVSSKKIEEVKTETTKQVKK